ncbi:P-loop containing nucleoside triphosphate hydrolase protein [Pilatotrama ljubarskyi]|nr:P-loop containing nucleoside triphosphate hydrolase protein [Pilatotrama ljubarskyi]
MSSDEYFDDELDSAFINAVDAIEAAHAPPSEPAAANRSTTSGTHATSKFKPTSTSRPPPIHKYATLPSSSTSISKSGPAPKLPPRPQPLPDVIEIDDSSDYGDAFDDVVVDEAALAQIDQICQQEYDSIQRGKCQPSAQPVAGPSRTNGLVRRPSKGAQLTLFGDVASEVDPGQHAAQPARQPFQRTRSRQMPLPGQAKKTKQWDRTAYAKSGWRKPKPAPEKGKGRASDGEDEEEHVEFEQFPAPEVPAPAMKLSADRLAAKTWIYPLNKPKRDYQYNIVKKCLFENTLVALPTGLGKTFIAGVVMLNYYNWFPEGKVVFVAPTKPLVAQQIDACHKTCGIPGSAAAELTGNVAKDKRINAWRTKRVFYATPQTFLNDLIQGHVDALDIVLIVIDEAHRGTGDYAYAQVVRFMMQHNPHFRIMALTATPGSKPEAVQEIVDALHISHIEIRNESDLDLKKYLHTKHEKEHHIQMTEDIVVLRDALASLMTPIIKKVQSAGFLKNGNVAPTLLHPFRCQSIIAEMSKAKAPQYTIGAAAQLGPLARAMGYLMENSIAMCYGYLKGIATGLDDSSSKKAIRKMEGFTNLMKEFDKQAARGFSMHPKMDTLRTLLIDHFAQELPDGADGADAWRKQSRAMVFVSFRECVEEIVELLAKESPIIRPKPFIGQGTDKQGKKGYAQKEQLEVIEQFKAGTYNVLVSTSIGEEGLDIGEVDLIVCYDAQKTPIRMLQRIGRTGRKQSGSVHILLAQGREEHNWQKAQSNYQEVQHFIVRASDLEVYGDVDRMIPEDIDPQPVEMEMEIEEYVREDRASRKGSLASPGSKSKKHKRDHDPLRNVPVAATKGFVSVRELLVKGGAGRRKRKEKLDLEHADEDDSDDEEIEAGLFAPRRAASTSAVPAPARGKKALARSATTAGPSKKKAAVGSKKKALKTPAQATLTQLDLASEDDSDDLEIERGLATSGKPAASRRKPPPPRAHTGKKRASRSSSPEIPLNDSVIDITTPDGPIRRSDAAMLFSSPDRPLKLKPPSARSLSRSSSPERPLHLTSCSTSTRSCSEAGRSSNSPARSTSPSSRSITAENAEQAADHEKALGDDSMAWLIEDDDEPDLALVNSSPAQARRRAESLALSDDEPLFLDSSPPTRLLPTPAFSDQPEFVDDLPPSRARGASPTRSSERPGTTHKTDMGPPALPAHIVANSSPSASDDLPPPSTFVVRPLGKQARKRVAAEALDVESSPLAMPPPSQRRLQRERPRSPSPPPAAPPKKKKRKFKDAMEAQRHNPWIDVEAAHSGDELSVGSSEPDRMPDSDDRMFLDEPEESQMSPSYDQEAVYRRSLLTQAGPSASMPVFAHGPARRGRAAFGPNRAGPSNYRRTVMSSPASEDEEPDEYVFGSFVVEDDAEISFTGGPSSDV